MSGAGQDGTDAHGPDRSMSASPDGVPGPHLLRRNADRLVRQHWGTLVRHAEIELGPLGDEAEDLVQDVLASLLAGEVCMRTVPGPSQRPYLKQVIRLRARNWQRRRTHQHLEEDHHPIERCDPWKQASRVRFRAELEEAVASLPPHERTVVLDSCFKGRSTREIAEREGVSEAAIWKRLARARQRLKASLRNALDVT